MGAILSVPMPGIQKILCSHANHPVAKYVLMLIREDATVDEHAERAIPELEEDQKKFIC